jgi:hypothetical protein
LYRHYYTTHVKQRIATPRINHIYNDLGFLWSRICCVALACLYRPEWGLGAPRLFRIRKEFGNDIDAISEIQSKHANPSCHDWNSILDCTMDLQELESVHFQEDIKMLTRYSERMDIGSFLLLLTLPSGPTLFRCKPIGEQTKTRPFADGSIILWDCFVFGICSLCNSKLDRLQVCADCRVTQYCSRECQKRDWDNGHKQICKSLAFIPQNASYLPT